MGLGLVGWGWLVEGCAGRFGVGGGLRWSVVGCAFRFEVGGLGLVGPGLCWKVWGWWVEMVSGGLCFWVWGWWVGVGWSRVVLEGLGLVGRG